jgi:hypothetical protein
VAGSRPEIRSGLVELFGRSPVSVGGPPTGSAAVFPPFTW